MIWNKISLVSPPFKEEKTFEVEELSFMSLSYLSSQDARNLRDEVTTNGTEPTYIKKY